MIEEEGCLSVPDFTEDVERASSVQVRFQSLNGKTEELQAEDRLARAVQHEVDHLNGLLYLDYLRV